KLNGRLAMIGFVSLLVLEVLTGHGIFGNLANL
ncbi:MAG: high light inducible protein, partial [Desertifilum sp. SIO1I2]|nr:high light inducible protein [Desertifilum sp. SIO1I2]